MEETVGPVSICRRELLRGWWQLIGLMVSFMIFTASVQNILDTPSYDRDISGSYDLTVSCCFIRMCFVHSGSCTIRNLKMEHQINLKFCVKLEKDPTETHEMLQTAFGFRLSWANILRV
jgi:hypothetical protein